MDDTSLKIGALYLGYTDSKPLAFKIRKIFFEPDEVVLSDDEVGTRVEELLNSFPKIPIKDGIELEIAKIKVAKDTKRGPANTKYNNTWFYKGMNSFDCPIIVCGANGRYVVIQHPDFHKYGFVIE